MMMMMRHHSWSVVLATTTAAVAAQTPDSTRAACRASVAAAWTPVDRATGYTHHKHRCYEDATAEGRRSARPANCPAVDVAAAAACLARRNVSRVVFVGDSISLQLWGSPLCRGATERGFGPDAPRAAVPSGTSVGPGVAAAVERTPSVVQRASPRPSRGRRQSSNARRRGRREEASNAAKIIANGLRFEVGSTQVDTVAHGSFSVSDATLGGLTWTLLRVHGHQRADVLARAVAAAFCAPRGNRPLERRRRRRRVLRETWSRRRRGV